MKPKDVIGKAIAERDGFDIKKHKNLLGSKVKYINAIDDALLDEYGDIEKLKKKLNLIKLESEEASEIIGDFKKENAELKAEADRLKAAITTPEVYAGVVSKLLEQEKDQLRAERDKLIQERDSWIKSNRFLTEKYDELKAEVARLKKEMHDTYIPLASAVRNYLPDAVTNIEQVVLAKDRIKELEADLARAVDGLKFYADKKNHKYLKRTKYAGYEVYTVVSDDEGRIATKLLTALGIK